ncbi:oligopeptide transporter [Hypomontagnella monticulosa]|nr:oligopeptide transporter [Hypomontagnella monticulosa]
MSTPSQSVAPLGHSPTLTSPEENISPVQVADSRPNIDSTASSTYPREATVDDLVRLRHVADKVPKIVWLVAFTGAAQRFAYYGTTVPWQNYLQNEPGNPLSPGALDFGQSTATIINDAFLFFSYLTPLPFAILSDSWLGRYKTLLLSLILFIAGEIVLFITALPFAVKNHDTTLSGLVVAMILIGLGQGGTTAVIFPFLGDQIPEKTPQVIRDKKGELVVTDPKLTIQFVFNYFYWMVNIAALATLATTSMEKNIGFWAAYLLPLCFLSASIVPFILWNGRLNKLPAQGNVLPHATKVLFLATRSGLHLTAADPSHQQSHHNRSVPWTSAFVQEIRRGLRACRVLICFTIFYLCFNQTLNNIISQANQMEITGISNDTVQSFNAIFYIILNPLIQDCLFPFLLKRRISIGPIARMTIAFILLAMAMAYAAGTQQLIYNSGPCFSQPLACEAAMVPTDDGTVRYRPNEISVWVQIPHYLLVAAGEIFGFVALNEFVYAEAPTNMKALVKAFEQFTAALGAALGMALGPVSKDPWLVIMYSALAGTMAVSGALFFTVFRKYDAHWGAGKSVEDVESSTDTEVPMANEEKRAA